MRCDPAQTAVFTGAFAVAVLVAACGTGPGQPNSPAAGPAAPANAPPSPELTEFFGRLDAYLQVRARAESKVPELKETSDPGKISAREKALADALRVERAEARQGEIFTDKAAAVFRRIIAADFEKRRPVERAAVLEEVPLKVPPSINTDYPTSLPLATVPPSLLTELPTLPDGLEYRFLGRHFILRDTKANLIVDFVPDVVSQAELGVQSNQP
jgi:chorismate mutase